jgi:hypothetical protein
MSREPGVGKRKNEQFLRGAVEVLHAADHPLTIREVTDEALRRELVQTVGKTPDATMSARLYTALRDDPDCPIIRLYEAGPTRARRGSVRWALRP